MRLDTGHSAAVVGTVERQACSCCGHVASRCHGGVFQQRSRGWVGDWELRCPRETAGQSNKHHLLQHRGRSSDVAREPAGYKTFSHKLQRDMEALIAVSHLICVQEVSATWAVFIAKLLPTGGEWKLANAKIYDRPGGWPDAADTLTSWTRGKGGPFGLKLFVGSVIMDALAWHGPEMYVNRPVAASQHRPIVPKL